MGEVRTGTGVGVFSLTGNTRRASAKAGRIEAIVLAALKSGIDSDSEDMREAMRIAIAAEKVRV